MVNLAPTPPKILFPALLTTALLEAFFLKEALTSAGAGLPNSDDLTRIVEVRDLMNGQGWFDLMQYRLGPLPGVEMHWSRLVDAPLAALVWMGNLVMPGQGELTAGFVWPLVTLFLAVCAILYGFCRVLPQEPLLPACVIGAFALLAGGVFVPHSFDHHNIQTSLALWLTALLLPGPGSVRNHAIAAFAGSMMLAIGIETLPYVAAAGFFVALTMLFDQQSARASRAFGLSLAASAAALFVFLVGPDRYLAYACDSFSSFQLAAALYGGFGLALAAHTSMTPRTIRFRFAGLVAVAIVTGLMIIAFFPNCLSNPLADMDPRLRKFWLDGILEAQSAFTVMKRDPFMLPGLFGLPLAALLVCFAAVRSNRARTAHLLFAIMLSAAILVTLWQMRGSLFALPFAAMPMAIWVAGWSAAAQSGEKPNPAGLIGAWLVSLSLFWGMAGTLGARLFANGPTLIEQAAASSPRELCFDSDLFKPLAGEPSGTLLGATNLGAPLLKYTSMRALAGPYHRNAAGNLALIDAMTGTPETAKSVIARQKISIVAVCVKGADEADFMAAAPGGFLQILLSGKRFDWLEPIDPSSSAPLRFWRVRI